jgi:ferrochelatase
MPPSPTTPVSTEPYDALLLVSFGGPERPADVVPFLHNVTRGRGIPRERLEEVAQHYFEMGGRSPINDQCRAFVAAVEADFAAHGVELPVYWGNRNWDPFLADAVEAMSKDGVRRAACFVTSAYSSYSGCRQYRENLFDALAAVEDTLERAPRLDRLRHYFNHPGFVAANADAAVAAVGRLPAHLRQGARLVFVTHSLPTSMADSSGPGEGGAYVAQHRSVARLVADQVAGATGVIHPWDLAYCSRSGPGHVPWLAPDVNDHLRVLHQHGAQAVVVVPIGFVSDHMEVVYDLDTEAAATAHQLGLTYERAGTAGTHPAFVAAVRDLVLERAAAESGYDPARSAVGDLGPCWDVCAAGCCPNPRTDHPTIGQESA